jgi:hypothetical protein
MKPTTSRRMVYLATIVALVGVTGGMALAAVLSTTTVNQGASFYQGGNSGANGYGAASLQVATTPSGTSTCTSGAQTGSSSGGTVTLILSSTTGGTVCTTGNFAEEFILSFSATISSQTNTVTITTQVGSGTVNTNSQQVTLGAGGSASAFTQTVDVFVDYGSVAPPASGVTVLDVVVQ